MNFKKYPKLALMFSDKCIIMEVVLIIDIEPKFSKRALKVQMLGSLKLSS